MVPDADNLVKFEVNGKGRLAGTDNGNPVSMESFQTPARKAFNGMCLAVIQSTGRAGNISLRVSAENLPAVTVNITAR